MIKKSGNLLYECKSPSLWQLKVPSSYGPYLLQVGYLGPQYRWATRMIKPDGKTSIRGFMSRSEAFGIIEQGMNHVRL